MLGDSITHKHTPFGLCTEAYRPVGGGGILPTWSPLPTNRDNSSVPGHSYLYHSPCNKKPFGTQKVPK